MCRSAQTVHDRRAEARREGHEHRAFDGDPQVGGQRQPVEQQENGSADHDREYVHRRDAMEEIPAVRMLILVTEDEEDEE